MTTLVEQLQAVEDLLSVPSRWSRNCYARDVAGNPAPIESRRAVSWCLLGACRKANGFEGDQNPVAHALALAMDKEFALGTVERFNDFPHNQHEDVLALIRRAKAAAATGEPQA